MIIPSPLARLLALLRGYFLRILKSSAHVLSPVALARIFQRLAFLWSIFRSRCNSWRKPKGRTDNHSSSSKKSTIAYSGGEPEPVNLSKEAALGPELERMADEYTIIPNGRTISIYDAAFSSLYPFAGGIHDASRSSHNLQVSRSAHNLAITTRNASRSSQRVGSSYVNSVYNPPYSNSAYSVSNLDGEDPITITIQPSSPRSPALEYSLSSPELHYKCPASSRPDPPSLIQHSGFRSPRDIDLTSVEIPDMPAMPASPMISCLENKRITPVMPEATQRYSRRPRIRKEFTEMTIEPLKTTFDNPTPPNGWIKFIHPEGARYFLYEEKRVYTDADLYDPKILMQAASDIATLEQFLFTHGIILPENTDLVIDLFYDEDQMIQTTYYYVHHTSRAIFFLDNFEANNLDCWYQIQGATTDSHLRHAIEAQYWYYVQLYPSCLEISDRLVSELRDVILHFIGDSMTSPTSAAPYTLDNLYKILPLTDNLEKNIGHQCVGAVSFLARQMFIFVHSRFLDFHGEAHARIERGFSVHGTPIHQRRWLIKTLSVFLFSAPDFHLRTLQNMWVDGIMHKSVWDQTMQKMIAEWQEFILFATIMLNANVAFLAIDSVDVRRDPYRSPAQISCYMSVVASIGSIVLGLLLARQSRTEIRPTVDEIQTYLSRLSHPRLGLETLAILHSLPYALLMWAVVSFVLAFSFMCFQSSSISTRILLGSFGLVVAVFIFWAVWTSWEEHTDDEVVEPLPLVKGDAGSSHISVHQKEVRPTIFSRVLGPVHAFLIRRQSADSEKTVVQV